MKEKIAFVCQRYGEEINGGSEQHCKLLAEKFCVNYDVEVFTTCAADAWTWSNEYLSGDEMINGVMVHRFKTESQRNQKDFNKFSAEVFSIPSEKRSEQQELDWIKAQGPVCNELLSILYKRQGEYKAIIFVCYLYYLTAMGLPMGFRNAYLLPTAHDEPPIYFKQYKKAFESANGFIWNTDSERSFVEHLYPFICKKPNIIAGVGVDLPNEDQFPALPDNLTQCDYIVYAGRIEESKGCDVMFRCFQQYKKELGGTLKLVLMGKASMTIPERDDIIYLGFVSDEMKFAVIRGAKATVLFSEHESLSMIVLESMASGRPVIVNGNCDVLRNHCINSGAGLYFQNDIEFIRVLNFLLTHPKEYGLMQKQAVEYVENNYKWNNIIKKIQNLIDGKASDEKGDSFVGRTTNPDNVRGTSALIEKCYNTSSCNIPHYMQLAGSQIQNSHQDASSGPTTSMLDSSLSIKDALILLRSKSTVAAYRPIYSHRKIIGRIIVFAKRAIRKLTKFYIEPITFDQNDVNLRIVDILEALISQNQELEREIEDLKSKLR